MGCFSTDARLDPQIWVTNYTIAPVCNNGICETNSLDDLPHICVDGQGFTPNGDVRIAIFRFSDNQLLYEAFTVGGKPGGSLEYLTGLIDCGPYAFDSFLSAYDNTSQTWSNKWYLYQSCILL